MSHLDLPRDRIELTVRFSIDRTFLAKSFQVFYRRPWFWVRLIVVLAAVLIPISVAINKNAHPLAVPVSVSLSILGFLFAWRLPHLMVSQAIRQIDPKSNKGLLGAHVVEVTPCAVTTHSAGASTTWLLDTVDGVERADGMLLVKIGAQFLPIPADGDFGRDTFETFTDKLRELWKRAKSEAVSQPPSE